MVVGFAAGSEELPMDATIGGILLTGVAFLVRGLDSIVELGLSGGGSGGLSSESSESLSNESSPTLFTVPELGIAASPAMC